MLFSMLELGVCLLRDKPDPHRRTVHSTDPPPKARRDIKTLVPLRARTSVRYVSEDCECRHIRWFGDNAVPEAVGLDLIGCKKWEDGPYFPVFLRKPA